MQKVSKKAFIQILENNEDNRPDKELAVDLGITPDHFSRLKKKYAAEIRDASRNIIRKNATALVGYLMRNAKNGSDNAAKYLLDMEKSLDMELMIKQLQLEIEKIKTIQAEQQETGSNMTLLRKTG